MKSGFFHASTLFKVSCSTGDCRNLDFPRKAESENGIFSWELLLSAFIPFRQQGIKIWKTQLLCGTAFKRRGDYPSAVLSHPYATSLYNNFQSGNTGKGMSRSSLSSITMLRNIQRCFISVQMGSEADHQLITASTSRRSFEILFYRIVFAR